MATTLPYIHSNGSTLVLSLHPVRVAINESVIATDCSLRFAGGSVGTVPASEEHRTHFGIWVMQSQQDSLPMVDCRGFEAFEWGRG